MIRAPASAARETYVPRARESQGIPSSTMHSGSGGSVRTMASAAAMAPSEPAPDSGSASTGQPSVSRQAGDAGGISPAATTARRR